MHQHQHVAGRGAPQKQTVGERDEQLSHLLSREVSRKVEAHPSRNLNCSPAAMADRQAGTNYRGGYATRKDSTLDSIHSQNNLLNSLMRKKFWATPSNYLYSLSFTVTPNIERHRTVSLYPIIFYCKKGQSVPVSNKLLTLTVSL